MRAVNSRLLFVANKNATKRHQLQHVIFHASYKKCIIRRLLQYTGATNRVFQRKVFDTIHNIHLIRLAANRTFIIQKKAAVIVYSYIVKF